MPLLGWLTVPRPRGKTGIFSGFFTCSPKHRPRPLSYWAPFMLLLFYSSSWNLIGTKAFFQSQRTFSFHRKATKMADGKKTEIFFATKKFWAEIFCGDFFFDICPKKLFLRFRLETNWGLWPNGRKFPLRPVAQIWVQGSDLGLAKWFLTKCVKVFWTW